MAKRENELDCVSREIKKRERSLQRLKSVWWINSSNLRCRVDYSEETPWCRSRRISLCREIAEFREAYLAQIERQVDEAEPMRPIEDMQSIVNKTAVFFNLEAPKVRRVERLGANARAYTGKGEIRILSDLCKQGQKYGERFGRTKIMVHELCHFMETPLQVGQYSCHNGIFKRIERAALRLWNLRPVGYRRAYYEELRHYKTGRLLWSERNNR